MGKGKLPIVFSSPMHIPHKCLISIIAIVFITATAVCAMNLKKSQTCELTESEHRWLAEHPIIKIGPDPNFPPIEWFDENRRFVGIAADYIGLVEKRLCIKFTVVHCDNWSDVLQKIKTHDIDMLSAAGETPKRKVYLNFSNPHSMMPGVIITRKEVRDNISPKKLAGMKVAIVSGYVWQEYLSRDYPTIKLDTVPDVQTGLRKVSFGMCDAMIENLATATHCIEEEGITNLRFAGETEYSSNLSFAVRNDWPELVGILDKAFAGIPESEKKTIFQHWVHLERRPLVSNKTFWIIFISLFLGTSLVIIVILVWNRSLARQVSQRTHELVHTVKRLENEAQERMSAEQKFLEMVENANSIILRMDTSGNISFFNKFAEDFFKFTKQEIIGKNAVGTIVPHTDASGADLAAYVKDLCDNPDRYKQNENENIRKNGQRVWVSWTNKPIFDKTGKIAELLCVGNDITNLKAVAAELKSERDFNSAIFETAGALVLVVDKAGTIVRFNKTCEIVTGYDSSEVIDKQFWDIFIPPGEIEGVREVFSRIESGHYPNQHENHWVAKNGIPILISWYNTALTDVNGTVEHIVSTGIDITQRRRVEQELEKHRLRLEDLVKERTRELSQTIDQLQTEIVERQKAEELARQQQQKLIQADKMATLGVLVSGVAHEINNPNNFIILNSDNIADIWKDIRPRLDALESQQGDFLVAGLRYSEIKDEVGSLINGISDGAKRIRNIVQNLKDFSRQEPFTLDQSVDINAVVEAAIVIVNNMIKKSTKKFTFEAGAGLPKFKGAFQKIEQVVINLVQNACQALTNTTQAITITTMYSSEKNRVIVKVSDEGAGISPENLVQIMNPFFTTKRDSGGTGLGLSISYNIVKEHGGDLFIESDFGKGTIATISLPAD